MVRMILAINSYYFSVGFYNAFCKVETELWYITEVDRRLEMLKAAASTCYVGCAGTCLGKQAAARIVVSSAHFASIRRQTSKQQRDDVRLPSHEMAAASIL